MRTKKVVAIAVLSLLTISYFGSLIAMVGVAKVVAGVAIIGGITALVIWCAETLTE